MCWRSTQSFYLAPSQRLLLNWMNVDCSQDNCGRWLAAFAAGCFGSSLSAATLCLLAFAHLVPAYPLRAAAGAPAREIPFLRPLQHLNLPTPTTGHFVVIPIARRLLSDPKHMQNGDNVPPPHGEI